MSNSEAFATLERKTMVFWKLSQVWNGQRNVTVQTGEAIEICGTLGEYLNPIRPLYRSNNSLLGEIVAGEGRKTSESKVLPFEKPIRKKARS